VASLSRLYHYINQSGCNRLPQKFPQVGCECGPAGVSRCQHELVIGTVGGLVLKPFVYQIECGGLKNLSNWKKIILIMSGRI
jgi:hypothetical protein